MRVFRVAMACLLVFGLAAAASAAPNDLMNEVEAIGDALAEAMVANDMDTMLAMYTDDAISLPNYGPRMDGIEAFRQHHAQMAAAGVSVRSFTSKPTEVWGCGDQVIEIGTYEIAPDMPGMPTSNRISSKLPSFNASNAACPLSTLVTS